MAALLAQMYCEDVLQGADVLIFCDNLGALTGLIAGHSPQQDTAVVLSVFHILIHKIKARVWGEHVESEANVADEPSRMGPRTKLIAAR